MANRYQALGIPYPDPETMCKGQCEGLGWVPIAKDDLEEPYHSLWLEAEAKQPSDDGWHFVKCPDCNGTGKTVKEGLLGEKMQEEWKSIPSLPNYIASTFGNIKRIANDPFWHRDKVRKMQINQKGYMVVNFQDANKKFQRKVHQLIAEAFIGICPKGFEVNHKDGNKLNNIPSNLEYITHKANVHHAIKLGNFYDGTENLLKRHKSRSQLNC